MTATGVPPYITQAQATAELQASLAAKTNEIREDIRRVPHEVRDLMLNEFQVNGAVPVNQANVQAMLAELQQNILQQLQQGVVPAAAGNAQPVGAAQPLGINWWESWYHQARGRYSHVPPDFEFPKVITVKPLWDLYLHGNYDACIRPYRLLVSIDLPVRRDKTRLSAMKTICQFILEHVPVALGDMRTKAVAETDAAFNVAWPSAVDKLVGNDAARGVKLRGDLAYMTVYNEIRKVRRAARDDEAEASGSDED